MNLPEFERVIYKRNPLVEVVCQLRFPPILKISHQEPVEFQDEIRLQYPLFETTQSQVPAEILKVVQQFGLPLQSDLAHSFKSEDQKWHLSITKDFIALTTSSYERYEHLIIRSKLGIEDKSWSDLIAKHIASELHEPELSSSIQAVTKALILKTANGQINFNHGLV